MPFEPHRKWLITFTVILGTFIAALDSSIVNVAMPSMRGTLGASTSEITWVATSYMLANVVIMPSIAFLSSRFGRARYFFGAWYCSVWDQYYVALQEACPS